MDVFIFEKFFGCMVIITFDVAVVLVARRILLGGIFTSTLGFEFRIVFRERSVCLLMLIMTVAEFLFFPSLVVSSE